jgi:hypothetical protein
MTTTSQVVFIDLNDFSIIYKKNYEVDAIHDLGKNKVGMNVLKKGKIFIYVFSIIKDEDDYVI